MGNLWKKIFGRRSKKLNEPGSRSLEYYLVDAIFAFENEEYKLAAKQFGLIAEAFPEHPLANLMLGRSLLELGEYEHALSALFNHINVVPGSVEGLIYLGIAYYECGEMERAEERFEQALQLRSESIMVMENLAITHISAGNLEEALNELVGLHEQARNDPGIVELIVLTLGKLGRWEAAAQYVHEMNKPGAPVSIGRL